MVAVTSLAAASVGYLLPSKAINMLEKSIFPVKILNTGIKISFTRELTIDVNALPMIIPTARSIMFPFKANFLKSSKNFFICPASIFIYSNAVGISLS